jgi:hypothetical protein
MRIQVVLAAVLALGGVGLTGCERDEPRNGARFEVEVDRPRNDDGALERVGESIDRGVERTGDELERAGENLRDDRRE